MIRTIALIMVFDLGTMISSINSRTMDMEPRVEFSSIMHENRVIGDNPSTAQLEQEHISRRRTKRVVFGEPVNEVDYPFIVELLSYDFQHKCGGTLLTPRLVLTAAHCLKHNLAYINVKRNSLLFSDTYYEIERSIPHPGYQFAKENTCKNTVHDIAILVLEDIPNAQPVQLIPPTHSGEFTSATLLGWGTTEHGDESEQLRRVTLGILPACEAEKEYEVVEGRICTDGRNGNMGPGDSGGPLMADGYQIGVASLWKGERCTDGKPAAFTRISAYRDWIDGHMRSYTPTSDSRENQCPRYSGGSQRICRLRFEDIQFHGCSSNRESS